MANALYPKLALTNLGKNKSTYFPYMLTSIVCIMTYYIMQSIAMNEGLMEVPGAAIAMTIFFLGTGIIAVFCIALMFYTNSFLIKRRKKELGLYCVLGMEKRHVALVLFFETLFTAIACLALGLVFGVLFSKLLFMALLYLLDFATPLAFSVSVPSLITTVVLFACIYGATLLYNMVHIRGAAPRRAERRKRAKNLLASHLCGPGRAGRRLFYRRIFQKPAECAFAVFCRCIPRHSRYVLPVHRRQHCSAESPAAPQEFLLQAQQLHCRLWHDVPHEAERRRPCGHLHPFYDGARHDLYYRKPVHGAQ